jgi:enoyl-[acyl-carrier protein] reductase II
MTTGSGCPAPNRVCEVARIDIPIIQAPMTYIAGAQLAGAVSNAGGLGIIETTSDQGRADLKRVRDLTDRSVGANIALLFNRDPAVVDLLVTNYIRFVTTSAGDPGLFTGRLHDAGIAVFHVVGTLASAKKAVDAGVDGLVVEGVEGGGFKNRFGASTMVLVPLVAAHVDVPIVAAGGICDARSMAAHLSSALKVCRWARGCSPRRIHPYTATSSRRSSAPTRHPRCSSPSTVNV